MRVDGIDRRYNSTTATHDHFAIDAMQKERCI
jgi:hypothetical protein